LTLSSTASICWTFLRRSRHRRPASAGLNLAFLRRLPPRRPASAGLSFVDFVIDSQHPLDFPMLTSSLTASIRWTYFRRPRH
jgi:hypothetical protein